MADEKKAAPKKPTHEIFFVADHDKDKKAFWQRIGAGWENTDGSINLVYTLMPVKPGTIQVRKVEEKKPEGNDKKK